MAIAFIMAKITEIENLEDSFAKFNLPSGAAVASGFGRSLAIPGLGPIGLPMKNCHSIFKLQLPIIIIAGQGSTNILSFPSDGEIYPHTILEVWEGPIPFFTNQATAPFKRKKRSTVKVITKRSFHYKPNRPMGPPSL